MRNIKEQEELYSQQVPAGKRKYFIDVKATKGGDKYITIAESRKIFDNNTGTFYFEKNKMFLYKEDFEKFHEALQNAFRYVDTGEMAPQPEYKDDSREAHDDYGEQRKDEGNDFHINEI